ncbi:MAG: ribosome small subunit-dependent GTPase A [Eubacteriales bacterium]
MKGIIIKGIGGFYYVQSNGVLFACKPRGLFRKEKFKPLTGDIVNIETCLSGPGTITDIFPRKNCLHRPPICNITQVVIISAIVDPEINYLFLNKIAVMAESIGIKVTLCFNKVDLIGEEERDEILHQFINTNYHIIFTSVKTGTGIEELKKKMYNEISVFSGASGVGKSSILNKIIPELQLQTGELSSKVSRGKHTTRHVELYQLDHNSFIADTPGFSNIDIIKDIPEQELKFLYPDFSQYDGKCKFHSCLHHKEPGCAIKAAVEGEEISSTRYESYIQLLTEIHAYSEY